VFVYDLSSSIDRRGARGAKVWRTRFVIEHLSTGPRNRRVDAVTEMREGGKEDEEEVRGRRITIVADRSTTGHASRMNYSRAILWNSSCDRNDRRGFRVASSDKSRRRSFPCELLPWLLERRTIERCAMSQGQNQLASFGTRSNLAACARPLIVRARPKCWDMVQGHVSRTKRLKNTVNRR